MSRPSISVLNVVSAVIGIDGFEVQHVPDDVLLIDDAVGAEHSAVNPLDLDALFTLFRFSKETCSGRVLPESLSCPRRKQIICLAEESARFVIDPTGAA